MSKQGLYLQKDKCYDEKRERNIQSEDRKNGRQNLDQKLMDFLKKKSIQEWTIS